MPLNKSGFSTFKVELGLIVFILAGPLGAIAGQAGGAAPQRPPIVGVAHIGLRTNDMAAARQFYGHVLGFGDFSLDKPAGGLMLTYFKVNDRQYIEIYPTLESDTQDRLTHIAFETTAANQLRDYLASRGVKVPEKLHVGLDGNISYMIKDAEGHDVEFVEYKPGSLHGKNFGKLLPETRISKRMIHVGLILHDRAQADALYRDILGFQLMWSGGRKAEEADWVDMRVPEGSDWLEYMLNVHDTSPKSVGINHHLALGVESIQPAFQTVLGRGLLSQQPPKMGLDGKWQLNLFDPNGTRAELMEFVPTTTPCCSPMVLPKVILRQ